MSVTVVVSLLHCLLVTCRSFHSLFSIKFCMWRCSQEPTAPGGACPCSGRKTPPGLGWGQKDSATLGMLCLPWTRGMWQDGHPAVLQQENTEFSTSHCPAFLPGRGVVASARLARAQGSPQHSVGLLRWSQAGGGEQLQQLSWDIPSCAPAQPLPAAHPGQSTPCVPWASSGVASVLQHLQRDTGLQPQHTPPSSSSGMFLARGRI